MGLAIIDQWDKTLSAKIHKADYGILNHVIFFFAIVFNSPVTLIVPMCYIYWRGSFTVNNLAHYGALTLLGLFATLTLKKRLGRPRPIHDEMSKKSKSLRKKERNNSMPSGDSLQAGIFASYCFLNFGEFYWFFVMLLVMYGRVHFVCHYVADTVIGAGIALILAFSFNDIIGTFVNTLF